MIAILETYSTTSVKGKIKPLEVKLGPTQTFDQLVKHFSEQDFLSTKFDRNYYDIFLDDYGYEISIYLGHDGGSNSIIQMSVYNPKGRGRTRRRLKYYYAEVEELFKDYIK